MPVLQVIVGDIWRQCQATERHRARAASGAAPRHSLDEATGCSRSQRVCGPLDGTATKLEDRYGAGEGASSLHNTSFRGCMCMQMLAHYGHV